MLNIIHPHKRRRLTTPPQVPPAPDVNDGRRSSTNSVTASTSTFSLSRTETKGGVTLGQTAGGATASACCTSCRRALNVTRTGIVPCSRCSSLSCLICARRCTRSVPSYPPTPHLSFTPTPNPSPTLPTRRLALFPNTHTLNSDDTPHKRKKDQGESDDEDDTGENTCVSNVTSIDGKTKEEYYNVETDVDIDGFGYAPGCGRIFCKACCYEDRDVVTCFWCNGTPTGR